MPHNKPKSLNWYTIETLLKTHQSFIGNSLNFLIICPRDVDEDTKKVMFDINILYTSAPDELRVEGLYYFVTKYVEYLHLRFRNFGISFRISQLYTKKKHFVKIWFRITFA